MADKPDQFHGACRFHRLWSSRGDGVTRGWSRGTCPGSAGFGEVPRMLTTSGFPRRAIFSFLLHLLICPAAQTQSLHDISSFSPPPPPSHAGCFRNTHPVSVLPPGAQPQLLLASPLPFSLLSQLSSEARVSFLKCHLDPITPLFKTLQWLWIELRKNPDSIL